MKSAKIFITPVDAAELAKLFLMKIYFTDNEHHQDCYQENIDELRKFMTAEQKTDYRNFENNLVRSKMIKSHEPLNFESHG